MTTSAILLAAGAGRRLGAKRPKGWVLLGGRPLLDCPLRTLERIPEVFEIVLVVHPDIRAAVHRWLRSKPPLKPVKVVLGGPTRQESVRRGLEWISPQSRLTLTHDAARALVSPGLVLRVIHQAMRTGAAAAAVPASDTLVEHRKAIVTKPLDRCTLAHMQTPQAFSTELLKAAHGKAVRDRFEGTDEVSLVHRLGFRTTLVWNTEPNIKITSREDLRITETLLRSRK